MVAPYRVARLCRICRGLPGLPPARLWDAEEHRARGPRAQRAT
jgi:hypothetical protein